MTAPTAIPTPGQSPHFPHTGAMNLPSFFENDGYLVFNKPTGPPTSFPAHYTPATTPSRASFSGTSSPMDRMTSVPPSPDEFHDITYTPRDGTLSNSFPRSPAMGVLSPPASGYFDMPNAPVRAGLIRRLSRGAQNKLRRGPSTHRGKNRDQSSGPVALRRQNEGTSLVENAYDISDLELDGIEESAVEGLGLDQSSYFSTAIPPKTQGVYDIDAIPMPLIHGTYFEKFRAKKPKKPKLIKCYLDESTAKIVWSNYGTGSRKQMYVDDIKDIRTADAARDYLDQFERPEEDLPRWITIDYVDPNKPKGRTDKNMHLLAPDAEVAIQWVKYLNHLVHDRGDLMAGFAGNSEHHRRASWQRIMAKRQTKNLSVGQMDFADIVQTCQAFSIRKSERDLRVQFEAIDKDKTGLIDEVQFITFFRQLTERKDIRKLFDSIKSSTSPKLQMNEFLEFLRHYQGEDLDAEAGHWQRVFIQFATKGKGLGVVLPGDVDQSDIPGMSLEAFRDFLSSYPNTALKGPKQGEKLDRPLNEYFISSSHNTYLMGRQVRGQSSVDGYREALLKGCRCVEIDCWDGDNGKPVVTHGRTFTTRVSFLDCVKGVNRYAFVSSPYPIIISLEVHCSPDQQQIMVDMMKEQFGSRLVTAPLERREGQLPSPEQLREKILIKVKAPKLGKKPTHQSQPPAVHRRQRSVSAPDPHAIARVRPQARALALTPARAPHMPTPLRSSTLDSSLPTSVNLNTAKKPSLTGSSSSSDDESGADLEFDINAPLLDEAVKSKTSNIIQSLGELGIYAQGIKYSGFEDGGSKTYNHIFSFSESTFINRCKNHQIKEQLEAHNARYLMRVYPKQTRWGSSNFDPLQFWRRGVQMAATNWQNRDLGTQINDAMFAAGKDRFGYVLKPSELRPPHQRYSQSGLLADKLPKMLVRFSIRLISASMLQDWSTPGMNPYVELELLIAEDKARDNAFGEGGADASARSGITGIGQPHRRRTKIIEGNGYDPIWDQQFTLQTATKYPDLVFVRLTVWNSPDGKRLSAHNQPFAQFTAKLSSLAQGYRFFNMKNNQGATTMSKLFCLVQKEEPQRLEMPEPPQGGYFDVRRSSEEAGRASRQYFGWAFNGPRRMSSNRKRAEYSDSGSGSRP